MTAVVTPFRKRMKPAVESRTVALQAASAETAAAFRSIARVARQVRGGRPTPEDDELELLSAIRFFNLPGCWFVCADAALVLALQKSRDSGRALEPLDRERLESIQRRAETYARQSIAG